ncbi:MAG: sulfite exporter TauE/SafE family protein [Oscillospiraceae bacterium]|jgi:uncharacterized membrane protein YfcA|nr:sulfite exporter TauE/SafE family protein [Oscillospiraceae bacterium]
MGDFFDALAGILTGVLSGFGLGGGTLLMIYMTWPGGLSQHAAQGINLLYFIPCASGALVSHIRTKQVDFKAAIPAMLGGLPTAALSAWVALSLDGGLLRKIFGAALVALGLLEIFKKGK